MAEVHVGRRNNPTVPGDELDDLFDFDVPTDIFKDVDTDMDVPRSAKAPLLDAGKGNGGGLGVDEEIKVNKKRAPVAKLDEDRCAIVYLIASRRLLNHIDFYHLWESLS